MSSFSQPARRILISSLEAKCRAKSLNIEISSRGIATERCISNWLATFTLVCVTNLHFKGVLLGGKPICAFGALWSGYEKPWLASPIDIQTGWWSGKRKEEQGGGGSKRLKSCGFELEWATARVCITPTLREVPVTQAHRLWACFGERDHRSSRAWCVLVKAVTTTKNSQWVSVPVRNNKQNFHIPASDVALVNYQYDITTSKAVYKLDLDLPHVLQVIFRRTERALRIHKGRNPLASTWKGP